MHSLKLHPSRRWLFAAVTVLGACTANTGALDDQDEAENNDPSMESPLLSADAVAISPTADTYVISGDTNEAKNFGHDSSVHADGDSHGHTVRGFFRFDLTAYKSLSKAQLRIYVTNGSSKSVNFLVCPSTTWSETGTTWNNQPASNGAQVASIGSSSSGKFITVDVTSAAQAGKVLSLAMLPRSTDGFWFASRENSDASHRPVLVLEGTSSGGGTDGGTDGGTTDGGTLDTIAPAVTLTAPVSGTTVTSASNVSITATASDNVAVSKVEFYDGLTLLGTDTSAPYSDSWSVVAANNGAHSITAKAFDAAGNTATSATATVTVNIVAGGGDTTPPTVSVSSPASGASYTTAQTLNIAATANDSVGVAKVEFYDGTTLLGTDTSSPFTFGWALSSGDNGTHSLGAKAFDAAGNNTTSSAVSVTVNISAGGGGVNTDANFKVAFIGDTEIGSNFKSVLGLVKSEGAQMLMVQGDMGYGNSAASWFTALDSVLPSTFPVFVSEGNHDSSAGWTSYVNPFLSRWQALGVTVDKNNTGDGVYSMTYRGLLMVMVGQNGGNAASYSSYLNAKLQADNHTWRICSWHKNMAAMQIGGKGDEMAWSVYDTCRQNGAIVATAHEHSYERTKTLTNMQSQTVDTSCSDPANLCVGAGKTFSFVSGLGGNSVRDQQRCLPSTYPYGCKGEWAKIYTTNQNAKYGALFITFNVGGDPKKATGYFKNIAGETVDQFTVTKQ